MFGWRSESIKGRLFLKGSVIDLYKFDWCNQVEVESKNRVRKVLWFKETEVFLLKNQSDTNLLTGKMAPSIIEKCSYKNIN